MSNTAAMPGDLGRGLPAHFAATLAIGRRRCWRAKCRGLAGGDAGDWSAHDVRLPEDRRLISRKAIRRFNGGDADFQ
jgi:hypothetical protein